MRRYLYTAVVSLNWLIATTAAKPPTPPKPDYALLDALKAPLPDTAKPLWVPMAGSRNVVVVQENDSSFLRLPCAFANNDIDRASWDAAVKLDLRGYQGVQFQVFAEDLAPISTFTLYLQSGPGWYAGEFSLEETGRWVTVRIDKRRFHTEGSPTGWSRISTVRLSAWRGQNIDTTLYLANFGLFNADAPVVIVQDAKNWYITRKQTSMLEQLSLAYLLVHPDELTASVLKDRALLILAQSGPLPEPARTKADEFIRNHPVIASTKSAGDLGGANLITIDKLPDTADALLECISQAAPKLASKAVSDCMKHVGQFGPYNSTEEAINAIRSSTEDDLESMAVAVLVDKLPGEVEEAVKAGKTAEAYQKITKTRQALLEAYCAAQKPVANEQRLFWCHDAFGVKGMEWDEAVKILADNGFTGIIPNMLWAGVAYYKSDILPVAPEISEKGDQIDKCLAACKKYGIACHVWKVNWYMSGRSPIEFRTKMKEAGRTQVRFDGSPENDWLCPSSPENQKLEIDSMVEVATKYDVDGIHFDYIRYPDKDACFCGRCRELFEKQIGRKVEHWPADVRKNPALRETWHEFRRGNITPVVAAVAEAVHKNRPKVKVSAAVWPFWNTERDNISQDWKLWCEKGYMDFVCPMDYRESNAQFRNMIRLQKEWAGKVPCYPGIGESVWPQRDVTRLIDQIKITRQLNTGGFTVFNYGEPEAREIVPLCGKGITRKSPDQ